MSGALAAGESGHYVHWGVILISVTNLAIIAAMVLVFVLAILLPFPKGDRGSGSGDAS